MARRSDLARLVGQFVTFYEADGSGPFRATVRAADEAGAVFSVERPGEENEARAALPYGEFTARKSSTSEATVVRLKLPTK